MNCTIKDSILLVRFKGNKTLMNTTLDPISNAFEGYLANREGHNFPSTAIPKNHALAQYKTKCSYVIGFYNPDSLPHELCHAKYYLDLAYRNKIQQEWADMDLKQKLHIQAFLRRLGYSEAVHIDEYQAYRNTEKNNFFGKIF